jgi:hypothetical protein
MKTERNPLGFMGTGGIFERDGWWYLQYRDPETKRNIQIKVSQERTDALVGLALLMIGIFQKRVEALREIVRQARPEGLLPRDKSYRISGAALEQLFRRGRRTGGETVAGTGSSAADERARGGTVSAPQRTLDTPGDGGGKTGVRKGGEQPAAVRPRIAPRYVEQHNGRD